MSNKISCKIDGSFLKDAAALVSKLHTSDLVSSVMNNVGVSKSGGVIELSFGGYGSGVKTRIFCEEFDEEDFEVIVGSKVFSDILASSLGEKDDLVILDFHQNQKIISIASETKLFRINSIDQTLTPFPKVDDSDIDKMVEFCPKRLFNCVDFASAASDASSSDQTSKYMFFADVSGDPMCYGSDTAKLHVCEMDKELSVLSGTSVVSRSFRETINIASKLEKAEIGRAKNCIAIKFGHSLVKLPIVDVKQKPVERIIKMEPSGGFRFNVSSEQLKDCLVSVSKMISGENSINKMFSIKMSEEGISLETKSVQNGSATAFLKYLSKEGDIPDGPLLFSFDKFAPMIMKCKAKTVAFSGSGNLSPVYARSYGEDQEFLAVIMPLVPLAEVEKKSK